MPIPKKEVIGVVGNGQLGRMFAQAAHELDYRVWVFGPGKDSPAGQVADREFDADYGDSAALAEFSAGIRVATFEFENIPRSTLDFLASRVPTHPSPDVLYITQNRLREKTWLHENGFPVANFVLVRSRHELEGALDYIGYPAVLKTASFGYDGKGQARIDKGTDIDAAWAGLGAPEAVLEAWVDFGMELSVVCARNQQGETRCFPVCHNTHHHHILAVTQVPAAISTDLSHRAQAYTMQVAQAMKVVGLITAEFFLTKTGDMLFNELAPRPHNSGHFSIDACSSSQFRHHVLAVTRRPLPTVTQPEPAVMANILGDLWEKRGEDGRATVVEPPWDAVRALPGAHLHLYGKKEPRARRKMGHLTMVGDGIKTHRDTLWKLGMDQIFDPPRDPLPWEKTDVLLTARPFVPFAIDVSGVGRLEVDSPEALAKLRGQYIFQGADGDAPRMFAPSLVAGVEQQKV